MAKDGRKDKARLERQALAMANSEARVLADCCAAIDDARTQGAAVTFWATPRSVVVQIGKDMADEYDVDVSLPTLKDAIRFAAATVNAPANTRDSADQVESSSVSQT